MDAQTIEEPNVPVLFKIDKREFNVFLDDDGDLIVQVTGRKNKGMLVKPSAGNAIKIISAQ